MLLTTPVSITDISFAVGYNSVGSFTSHFTGSVSVPPSLFRQKAQNGDFEFPVQMAYEAYSLAGTSPAETYLDINKIVKIALDCGADTVHPGYGFLAENADFARAVTAAQLTWIGSPPEAIEALGDSPNVRVSGHVYHVETGLVTTFVDAKQVSSRVRSRR